MILGFGFSVSGAGDVNDDGFADLIVGALLDDNNGDASGSARLFSGMDGSVFFTFNGDSSGDRFGRTVSGAGDVNADGLAEVIVGAYLDDNSGVDAGSAGFLNYSAMRDYVFPAHRTRLLAFLHVSGIGLAANRVLGVKPR